MINNIILNQLINKIKTSASPNEMIDKIQSFIDMEIKHLSSDSDNKIIDAEENRIKKESLQEKEYLEEKNYS